MAKKVRLFSRKEPKSRQEASEFLSQLSERLAEGQVTLRQAGEDLNLEIPQNLRMKVKVTKKPERTNGARHKMTLQLIWHEGDQDEPLALG